MSYDSSPEIDKIFYGENYGVFKEINKACDAMAMNEVERGYVMHAAKERVWLDEYATIGKDAFDGLKTDTDILTKVFAYAERLHNEGKKIKTFMANKATIDNVQNALYAMIKLNVQIKYAEMLLPENGIDFVINNVLSNDTFFIFTK